MHSPTVISMSFDNFFLQESYKKVRSLGDRLSKIKDAIDWERFRPIVAAVYHDNKEVGGRPHTDEIIIVKALVLQALYGLSDPELEYQIHDRLSFRNFLGFPDTIPDFTTIWKARDRLVKTGNDVLIWEELQRQLDDKGYVLKRGVIQDATFIEADVGKKRYAEEKRCRKKGKSKRYSKKQKQHMDQDGSFAVKNNQVHYGYKTHMKVDIDYHLIRNLAVTTASVHDNEIDLVNEGDVAAYRDKGYFGKPLRARNVKDNTMLRRSRGRRLNGGQQKRNKNIARIRAPGERPFAVMKRVFRGGRTYVKTLERVFVKEMFVCFAYNLYQLVTLEKRGLA